MPTWLRCSVDFFVSPGDNHLIDSLERVDMPAYDRPIEYRTVVDHDPRNTNAVGAVLKFCPGSSVEQVQAFLDRLVERGIIEPTTAQGYNSNNGSPVWYIP